MSENVYVKAYMAQVEARQEQMAKHIQKVIDDGLPRFEENCMAWLILMLNECELGKCEANYIPASGVSFRLGFKWEGIEGLITSEWWGRMPYESNRYSRESYGVTTQMALMMGASLETGSFRETFSLPVEDEGMFGDFYLDEARRQDPISFGQFLVTCLKKKEKYEKTRAEYQEREERIKQNRLANKIFCALDKKEVQAAFDQAVYECVAEIEYWTELARKRTAQLDADEEREKSKLQAQKDWQDELDRLEKLAEEDFKPFTIYKIRYGAKAENRGEEWGTSFYETEDWSPDPAAGQNGLWRVLRFGSETPARIVNLIAVEEYLVSKPSDAPYGVLGKKYFESEKYEGMSAEAWDLSPVLPEAAPEAA